MTNDEGFRLTRVFKW